MATNRASLEKQLAAARQARARLRQLEIETDGWDNIDEDAIDEFISRNDGIWAAFDPDQERDGLGRWAKGLIQRVADSIKRAMGLGRQPAGQAATFAEKVKEALKTPVDHKRGMPVIKIDGKLYLAKKDRYSRSEAEAAKYSKEAGVTVAPVRTEQIDGRKLNLVEMVEGKRVVDFGDADLSKKEASDRAKSAALSKLPHAELERHALYDYLIGYTDGNQGNYLIHGDKFIGIDKDPSFSEGKGDSTEFERPDWLQFVGDQDFEFSKPEVDKMADAGDRIAAALEKSGQDFDASGVSNRVEVLRKLTELHGDRPTLGQLETLGAGFRLGKSGSGDNVQGAFSEVGRMRIAVLQGRGDPADPGRVPYGTIENLPDGTFELVGDRDILQFNLDKERKSFQADRGYAPAPAELLRYMAKDTPAAKIGKVRIEFSGPPRPRLLVAE